MDTPTPNHLANLAIAAELGASAEVLETLRTARYVAEGRTVVLPKGKYEDMYQGCGGCAKFYGFDLEWGDRQDDGYRVGPGRWTVFSEVYSELHRGRKRRSETRYTVKHVTVGDQVWTVAT